MSDVVEFRFAPDIAGELFYLKLAAILNASVLLLPADDRLERIERCRHTGDMLLTLHDDEDAEGWMVIRWAGRRLCVVDRALLDDAVPLDELWDRGPKFLPEVPDDLSGLT